MAFVPARRGAIRAREGVRPFCRRLHDFAQRTLPVTCVAPRVPSVRALGEARTSARDVRMPADHPARKGPLRAWCAEPVRFGESLRPAALDHVYGETDGYPYFVQGFRQVHLGCGVRQAHHSAGRAPRRRRSPRTVSTTASSRCATKGRRHMPSASVSYTPWSPAWSARCHWSSSPPLTERTTNV